MSMNIHFGTETCEVPLFQTPTDVSRDIMRADDKMSRYMEYVQDINPEDRASHEATLKAYMETHPTAEWSIG
jgi:hypothetical protein